MILSHSSGDRLENRRFSHAVFTHQDQGGSDIPEDHIFNRFVILYLKKRNFHGIPPSCWICYSKCRKGQRPLISGSLNFMVIFIIA